MNEKFYSELTRRLRQEGIAVGTATENRLPILVNGQEAMAVTPKGAVFVEAGMADSSAADQVYDVVGQISSQVWEYTAAMETAPRLEADGLHEGFRLLAEFNGVVLAGREMEKDFGYQFVTWRRSPDHTAVAHGNYYHNDYDATKLDFACRAGLVQKSRQFTDKQLTEIYRCVSETLDSGYFVTRDREEILAALLKQIEYSVDDLKERVNLSNQQELEAADRQDRAALGLTF